MVDFEFEWDAAKAASNFVKHGVSFEEAGAVFDDLFAYELCDVGSDPEEIRYVIIGTIGDVVLTVVYAERGNRIRIISARKATSHEQREYYRSQTSE